MTITSFLVIGSLKGGLNNAKNFFRKRKNSNKK